MMTLFEVKNIIFQTECENLLLDGLCCSEPIMTRDAKGIIDNYFVYDLDRTNKSYSGPIVKFGIYSETTEVSYIDKDMKLGSGKGENDYFSAKNWGVYDNVAYGTYVNSFSYVREFIYENELSTENKKQLKIYLESLRSIIDDSLWEIYMEVNPTFFEWVKASLPEWR